MQKYNGVILDSEGCIVFEFTTAFLNSVEAAEKFAVSLLNSWRESNPNEKFYYDLETN